MRLQNENGMAVQIKRCLFALVGAISLLLAGSAQCADESLPPEVKALVGMKFQPEAPGKPLVVPGWQYLNEGALINDSIGFVVLQRGTVTILAIESIDSPDRRTILDARVIQGDVLQTFLKDGKIKWKNNLEQMYRVNADCSRSNQIPKKTVIAIWRYADGHLCDASFTIVRKAWLLDTENGHLSEIPTQGVSCRGPSDCVD